MSIVAPAASIVSSVPRYDVEDPVGDAHDDRDEPQDDGGADAAHATTSAT